MRKYLDFYKNLQDSRSLVAGKSPIYWLKFYVSFLIATIATISSIIGITRIYEPPLDASGFFVRIVPVVVILVLIIPACATLIKLSFDYKKRYHIQRNNIPVRDVYPDRTWLQRNYEEIFQRASKRIIFSGISLHTLVTSKEFDLWVNRSLEDKKDLQISLLFQRPFSEIINQKEKEEKRSPGRISGDCLVNIRKALALKSKLSESQGKRFRIYLIDDIVPVAFILLWDDEVYFEPYLSREIGRTCPTFVLRKNQTNEKVFLEFDNYVNSLIKNATEDTSHLSVLQQIVTEFGIDASRHRLRNAIFLDRDGVIIEDKHYLSDPNNIEIRPFVKEALLQLQNQYRLIIITNQSGVARGYFPETDVYNVNNRLLEILEFNGIGIDGIFYCPHHPEAKLDEYRIDCDCRKPKQGLIRIASKIFELDLKTSILIGDKDSDIQAGKEAGSKTIKIINTNDCDNETDKSGADFLITSFEKLIDIMKRCN